MPMKYCVIGLLICYSKGTIDVPFAYSVVLPCTCMTFIKWILLSYTVFLSSQIYKDNTGDNISYAPVNVK